MQAAKVWPLRALVATNILLLISEAGLGSPRSTLRSPNAAPNASKEDP